MNVGMYVPWHRRIGEIPNTNKKEKSSPILYAILLSLPFSSDRTGQDKTGKYNTLQYNRIRYEIKHSFLSWLLYLRFCKEDMTADNWVIFPEGQFPGCILRILGCNVEETSHC